MRICESRRRRIRAHLHRREAELTRGFVTIATGSRHYYAIAANLLASYRLFAKDPLPFALICDRDNEYTDLFDDVVLLENPKRSYLDKLALPEHAPYDETIFIDADCLAYRDLNDFWSLFEDAGDFSAFGVSYPTTYEYAWFKQGDVGEYGAELDFIPDFIGGVYYIRKTEGLKAFAETCSNILARYSEFSFRQFSKPADEPIFALAMAIHGFQPVRRELAPICFYPHATSFSADMLRGEVRYASRYEPEHDPDNLAYLVHWVSGITRRPVYLREVAQLRRILGYGAARAQAAYALSIPVTATKDRAKAVLSKLNLLDAARSAKARVRKLRYRLS